MKIAIIGQGLFADNCYKLFKIDFGAHVVYFNSKDSNKTIINIHKVKTPHNNYNRENNENKNRILNNFRIVYRIEDRLDCFEEFDIVIDATNIIGQTHTNLTESMCLNETLPEVQKHIAKDFSKTFESDSLFIICDKYSLEKYSLEINSWFSSKPNRQLFIYSDENINYEIDLFKNYDQKWQMEVDLFLKKIDEWKLLSKEKNSKISKPDEPKKQIEILNDYLPYAYEKMDDQNGLFVILEKIDSDAIKSVLCDDIVILRNKISHSAIYNGLNLKFPVSMSSDLNDFEQEPGFFYYRNYTETEDNILENITEIENKVLKFFTKVE